MATISDFKLFIEYVELDNHNDTYCLYKSLQEIDEWGAFKCTKRSTSKGSMYFIKCDYFDEVLMLASDKARVYMLDYITNTCTGGMDMEVWFYLKEENQKEG